MYKIDKRVEYALIALRHLMKAGPDGLVTARQISEQYLTAFNREDYDVLDSWDRWDARFSLGSQDLTWEVTAFVKNITDDREGRPDDPLNDQAGVIRGGAVDRHSHVVVAA